MVEISIITARVVETTLAKTIKATTAEKCKLERDGETVGAELAGARLIYLQMALREIKKGIEESENI